FSVRESRDRHRVFLEAPVELIKTGNRDEHLRANTALITKIIEGHIRCFPEEWWWLHRRWRKAKKKEEL
ncbi:MAG: lipid A biosynthesis acyltransferase, partial [Candidatus Binatia bacterium]|nr:lipid A biosynthesis acyltransferase [Candidatus Binatia bacterium]